MCLETLFYPHRVTNNIRVKKTRPEKREGGGGGAGSSECSSNPYEVKQNPANPYEVKANPANPYEVKILTQEERCDFEMQVKSNPTNPRAPDRQQRISNSSGVRPVTPQVNGRKAFQVNGRKAFHFDYDHIAFSKAKKASPKHGTTTHHLADSLSPINSNKSR